MTHSLGEPGGEAYRQQQYWLQLKRGTGWSGTGLRGWDGDREGTSAKLGLLTSFCLRQLASRDQTKPSLGHDMGSSHSHRRLNTLKMFPVAGNSKLNYKTVFPSLEAGQTNIYSMLRFTRLLPPSSPLSHESGSTGWFPWHSWASPGTRAPCLVRAQQKHRLCYKDGFQGLVWNCLLTAAFELL